MMNYIDRLVVQNRNHEQVEDYDEWHLEHCFDYLRNTIMCCGDTTLEGQAEGSDLPGTDGLGAMHMCKNYDEIFAWAEANRVTDLRGL
jgi:hypothetical protein